MRSPRLFCRYVLIVLLLATPLAQAQDSAQPIPKPEAGEVEAKPAREQTIYIPYTKLRQIFEKEGRGVFVPYDEFQRLWKAAQAAAKKVEEFKPPVATLIAEIDSRATVTRDVMTVEAKLQVDVLAEGWQHVYLRLKDAAIHSATIEGKPARLVFEANKGYWVLVEKKGKEPERIELLLTYSKAYTKQPGTNSVEFEAPQAPVNRWQIRLAEPGVKVNVHPNISATDSGAEDMGGKDDKPEQPAEAKKETLVQAFVGAADKVRTDWTAKAEGAAGLAALVTVQARQEVTIDEGVVRTQTNLTYDIQRADVTQLTVEVPADHSVVNVFDPNVQKWEKQTEGPLQTLTITLFQPTRGTQNVAIELEKFAGDREMPQEMMHAEIRAPVVRAVQAGTSEGLSNIGRQQGIVVVRLGTSLRGEATSRTGLLQIDAAELPAPLAKQPWSFAYRYAALPFDLVLSVEKLLPLIEVEELVEVYVEPNTITANLLAILNIQRAGVFQIELDVPEGYEVRTVQGREAAGASAVAVDAHHLDEVEFTPNPAQPEVKAKRKTKLLVNLGKRAIGKVALWIELVKRQDDPNLLTPTAEASTIALPLPRVQPASVARTSGRLLVYAPENLRINPKEIKGLRPISPAEAVSGIESTRAGRFPQHRELLAYAYTQEAASLSVEAQRRKPYIEVRELLAAHIESGVVRYEWTFVFDIKYSAVKTLRLDVPKAIAADLRNLTPALREQPLDPQPEDVAADYVVWQLAGEGDLIGSVVSKISWEKKFSEPEVGTPLAIDLPQIKPAGVDRFWGQIAASKAETIEISVKDEPKGLRPIDPQRDLVIAVPSAARAFEFHEDWTLNLQATRYQLEEVKRTSIDRALVRMVATRGGRIAVQAVYRLRSARQRVPVVLPGVDPADAESQSRAFDAQALRINNKVVGLESDKKGLFFIPLTNHSANEPVLVELRYTVPGGASRLSAPEFQDDPAVQQVHLAAYLPAEWKLLGIRGPWTNESATTWIDRPWCAEGPSDEALLAQLRQGIASCESAGEGFETDGRRYLFSTLQPPAGPAGALRLFAAHENAVHACVFLLVAIAGVVLTPQPAAVRLWWLAGLLISVVILAVFAPTIAAAILGWPLYVALGLVLAVWAVRCLAWFIPGCIEWSSGRLGRAAVATTFVAAASAGMPGVDTSPPIDNPFADHAGSGQAEKEGGEAHE